MKLKRFFFILCPTLLFSQNFPYQRDWGTYYGGVDTNIQEVYEDLPSNSLFVDASTFFPSPNMVPPPASYYNQFIHGGGQPYTGLDATGLECMSGKFSPSGTLLFSGYITNLGEPIARDDDGNIYYWERPSVLPTLPSGVWLSNPITTANPILKKYDKNNNLLWKTYIPDLSYGERLKVDSNGNVYLSGKTAWPNIGSLGTFQPDFVTVLDFFGNPKANSYIVKLNPQGQKIWGTYIPTDDIGNIDVYQDNVYVIAGTDLLSTNSLLSTPGSFQSAKSNQSIFKIDGNTGQRIWGTYYGITEGNSASTINHIKVNDSGVYILGDTRGTPSTYYATPNAHKLKTTDGNDLFLAKFDHNGMRVWGTYIGSDEFEMPMYYKGFDVKNDKLLMTGLAFGNQSIASPGAFISTKPNPDGYDLFFTMFNTSGEHLFTSYYGGNITNIYNTGDMSCRFSKNSDSFYLYGTTPNHEGFATPEASQSNIIYPPNYMNGYTGFLAKFTTTSLSTSETNLSHDLVLYNNPNNGDFNIKGSVLEKEAHMISIHDMAGRLVYSDMIPKNKEQSIKLSHRLSNGHYILSVTKTDKTLVKNFKLTIKK